MFTLVAFSEDTPFGGVQYNIASVQDNIVKNDGDAIIVPNQNKFFGAHGVGIDIDQVQVISPSLRRLALYDLSPVDILVTPGFPPHPTIFKEGMIDLDIGEELTVIAANAGGASNRQESCLIFLTDGDFNYSAGKIFTVKADITGTVVAYEWSNAVVTYLQSLPVGLFQLVGARFESSPAIAFRMIPIGTGERPGGIAVADRGIPDPSFHRRGGLGKWFTFEQSNEPSIEILSSTTVGAGTLYIDLIKVG